MAEYCRQGVFRFIYYMILLCKVENSGKEIFNDITHSACQIAFTCNKYLQVSERRRNEDSRKVS